MGTAGYIGKWLLWEIACIAVVVFAQVRLPAEQVT